MSFSGFTKVKIYDRIQRSYSSKGTIYGSNAEIYNDIVSELDERGGEIEEVHLALYLFNNIHLYRKLFEIADRGARVIVTSLPLTGYDRRKIRGAESVYLQALEDEKIGLKIFPHLYYWYGARYAGDGASYSFHIKAGLIKYFDGTSKVFITSGNLAPGDPTHSETAIFIEAQDYALIIENFSLFFEEIERRAIDSLPYHEATANLSRELKRVFDFSFIGGTEMINLSKDNAKEAFFTAPFITFEGTGSNHYARERLVELILSAKERLLICAQHSHDISPFNGCMDQTLISSILELKESQPGVDIRNLKQVASSGLADKRRAAFVESHLYHAGVQQKYNRLIHDKFIVSDKNLAVGTGNLTATQFGWGNREMKFKTGMDKLNEVEGVIDLANSFFKTPERSVWTYMTRPRTGSPKVEIRKKDIFSEVNAFIFIEDTDIANQLSKYYNRLWSHNLSKEIEIPL